VTGFESLTGVQDVRRGFQASSMLGRSVALLGSRDDDYFVSGNLYAGVGGGRSFLANEVRGEARHDNGTDRWRGLVVGGRSAWYLVPGERWRFVTSAQFSGVWRPRVPIQIQLGTRDGGVRGYDGAVEAGNARVVLRAESRYVLGALGNVGDLGVAAFADAGRMWAGGAPYGVDSPVRAALGVGALGAFPRGSRKLWRVDVARPLSQVPGAPKVQFILENRDLTRFFWREPRDVELGRERASPVSVFNWP
jgi:hemolysin activation/secretion protein